VLFYVLFVLCRSVYCVCVCVFVCVCVCVNVYCTTATNPSDRPMALGVDSASNRNEYQEYFLGVNAAGA